MAVWAAAGALFVLLATANGAGYRYGVSDQAFYIPVVARAIDPGLFPRDALLIDAQGRLMLVDEILAWLARSTGISLEGVFLAGYVASLGVIWAGLVLIGTRVYRNPWAVAALGAAFTMRHRIPRTSVNSLEPYFNPRVFAFGLGTLAVAAVLRHRPWLAIGVIAVSALIHITTALWFAMLVGVALAILDAKLRRLVIGGATLALIVLLWASTSGPLRAANVTMDDVWMRAVASKDSLFPNDWPLWAWLANLGFLGLLWWAHRWRARRGDATPEDAALVWGATALVAVFLVTLPAVASGLSLAVQFQISRVFWLVDFLALVYVIAAVADSRTVKVDSRTVKVDSRTVKVRAAIPTQTDAGRAFTARRSMIVAAVLVALSTGRGTYVMRVERPDRALFEVQLPDSPWEDAMRWVARQPPDEHVLADPGHAWKYGTSVRVSAERDVLLEEVKDSALAIYSRDVAVRFVERTDALGDFASLTAERARNLARRYDLDYLVTEADVALPVAYRNDRFRIYSLR